MEFKSLQELYKRIYPALLSKKMDLYRCGYNYIKEEDIWNCLRESKWKQAANLSLSEMVNDVLLIENRVIDNYFKKEFKNVLREADFKETKETL
jgi:hypothetical protein